MTLVTQLQNNESSTVIQALEYAGCLLGQKLISGYFYSHSNFPFQILSLIRIISNESVGVHFMAVIYLVAKSHTLWPLLHILTSSKFKFYIEIKKFLIHSFKN